MTPAQFRKTVWNHYQNHKRTMPWRSTKDPYKIFVSEIMLQQTQVSRVMEKYPLFIKRFPTFKALAQASQRDVLEEWMGLGYNRRGLNLKRSAEMIVRDFAGKLPESETDLLKLPGIGPATAGSLQAFVFNKPVVFIETNVRSVYIHHFFSDQARICADDTRIRADTPEKNVGIHDNDILPFIEKTLDTENPREWYYALMDYGTFLKKHVGNSSQKSRHYTKQSTFEGSNRQIRARIIKTLIEQPHQTRQRIKNTIQDERVITNLINLEKEGLIARAKTRYYIPQ